jgi:hypothetical protein
MEALGMPRAFTRAGGEGTGSSRPRRGDPDRTEALPPLDP